MGKLETTQSSKTNDYNNIDIYIIPNNMSIEFPCKTYKPSKIIIDLDGLVDFKYVDEEIFMPYIDKHVSEFLKNNWSVAEVIDVVNEIKKESFDEKFIHQQECPLVDDETSDVGVSSVIAFLEWQKKYGTRIRAVLRLHKLILEKAFEEQKIKLTIDDETFQILKSWNETFGVYIITSLKSQMCQKILASFTNGDLNENIVKILTDSMGPLVLTETFLAIVKDIDVEAKEILLLTSSGKMGKAAEKIGIDVILLTCPWVHHREYYLLKFPYVSSLSDIQFVEKPNRESKKLDT